MGQLLPAPGCGALYETGAHDAAQDDLPEDEMGKGAGEIADDAQVAGAVKGYTRRCWFGHECWLQALLGDVGYLTVHGVDQVFAGQFQSGVVSPSTDAHAGLLQDVSVHVDRHVGAAQGQRGHGTDLVARDAGLGELGRMGLLMTPRLGPRVRLGVVTTDMPLTPDHSGKDDSVLDYCQVCKKCARECPSQAISHSDEMIIHNDYETYELDVEACTRMRVGNAAGASCGRCIKVCPWNRPYLGIHKMVEWFLERSSLSHRFWVWMDDLLGYGKQDVQDKWWYDLEEIEGVFQVPKKAGALRKDSKLVE